MCSCFSRPLSFTGSGAIEFNEFSNLMAQRYSEIKEMKEITDAFKMFDRNGDGVISASIAPLPVNESGLEKHEHISYIKLKYMYLQSDCD
jgi:calmodulin